MTKRIFLFLIILIFTLVFIYLYPFQGEYIDDFSPKHKQDWQTYEYDGISVQYDMGGLRFNLEEPNIALWSTSGIQYQDVELTVDASKISGSDINMIGLICRFQDDDNYYAAVISSDQTYAIFCRKDGQKFESISAPLWVYNDAIKQGNQVNYLELSCEGNILTFTVNGTIIDHAVADDFETGQVGLLVTAYEKEGVDIVFDNFTARSIIDE